MPESAQRILVSGASGYLGGYLVQNLKARGYWVRALVRDASRFRHRALVDDVFVGEVTRPATLDGLCADVDVIISALGITRQKDGLTYEAVDFGGNLNLLRQAEAEGVTRFAYVSVFGAKEMAGVRIVDAKERFVAALRASDLDYIVIRPNGFFSDMVPFFDMARRGRVFVFGNGGFRMNPIHGADLAAVCADCLDRKNVEIDVGGPDVMTHDAIARAAFVALGRPPRITHVPVAVAHATRAILRAVMPVRVHGPTEFTLSVLTRDMVAPNCGEEHLDRFFDELARAN